ncbi:MAG: DUF2617 family protein [Phycisphaerales bacterium]|nr:DUF2617 family protein [Phycisphaerales bacterium]
MTIHKMEFGTTAHQAVDLHLFLFERGLHPELFRRYATYRVAQGKYFADIWVVGLGHLVTVTSGTKCATELLGPDSELLPSRGVLTRFRLKGERDHERNTPDGWHYMVSTQIETMDEALYKSVHADLLRFAAQKGTLTTYEQWGEGDMMPFSFVDTEARDSEFHVHAFHAFPAERTLVKTQSIFELPG